MIDSGISEQINRIPPGDKLLDKRLEKEEFQIVADVKCDVCGKTPTVTRKSASIRGRFEPESEVLGNIIYAEVFKGHMEFEAKSQGYPVRILKYSRTAVPAKK